jgi:hypothetical protein
MVVELDVSALSQEEAQRALQIHVTNNTPVFLTGATAVWFEVLLSSLTPLILSRSIITCTLHTILLTL